MERSEQKANAPERSTTDPTGAVSKLEMGEEGRSETANRQPGLLHWLEVLHREVLDQAERTSCMVAPP